jgi:hypothetical protein
MKNKSSIRKAVLVTIAMTSFISCKKTTKTETPVPTPTPRDAQAILVGRVWKISSRVENGGTASLPNCAKDDILEFKTNGTFNSLVDTTLCNPMVVISFLEIKKILRLLHLSLTILEK